MISILMISSKSVVVKIIEDLFEANLKSTDELRANLLNDKYIGKITRQSIW